MAHADGAGDRIPSRIYEAGAAAGRWQADPAQRATLGVLDRIQREAIVAEVDTLRERVSFALGRHRGPRGLYLWGGVGRGKTFLLDLLHDTVPEHLRLRLHFHRFMGRVHAELARVGNVRDPLKLVAKRFAERPLLCLDEFFVQDIGDAMMLAELLRHLFRNGATLATTSNIEPAGLYRDGLQRAKFLPAIELIERHCEVIELVSPVDYRLRTLTSAPVYHHPLGDPSEAALRALFDRLAPGSLRPEPEMVVNDRPIALKRRADGIAWFEFSELCDGPRSVADYIEIAKSYNTVVLSNVPQFEDGMNDPARRFVHLVDEFYDRNVNLILSAAAPPTALYCGERLRFEFGRTASRLIEMQSEEYLARGHRP